VRYVVTKQEVKFEEREVTEGVTLCKRARSRLWQARIRRVSGTWISISTRTEDLEVAKAVALRRHQEMKDAQARGEIDVVRKFSDVANLTMKELESELASGVGRTASTLFGSATRDCLIHRRSMFALTCSSRATAATDAPGLLPDAMAAALNAGVYRRRRRFSAVCISVHLKISGHYRHANANRPVDDFAGRLHRNGQNENGGAGGRKSI
jgi:hypothetical protein